MVCAQSPLKLGSEIVINSAFVILFHAVLEPAMNFPNANANKSLFQGQGNFLIIGCISRKYQGTFSSQGWLQTTVNIVLILSELNRMHFRQSIKCSTYRVLLLADPCLWMKETFLPGRLLPPPLPREKQIRKTAALKSTCLACFWAFHPLHLPSYPIPVYGMWIWLS